MELGVRGIQTVDSNDVNVCIHRVNYDAQEILSHDCIGLSAFYDCGLKMYIYSDCGVRGFLAGASRPMLRQLECG